MPSKNWLKKNPKVSAHISQELYQQIQEFMEQQGIQSNAEALKTILNEYFNSKVVYSEKNSSLPVDQRLTTLENKIDSISKRIIQIIEPDQKLHSSPLLNHLEQQNSLSVVNSSPLPIPEEWLTTGEAFSEAQRRGYTKAKGSFRRGLRSGSMPTELERIGLVANWEARQQANPKDNSVRWLKFED